jgi:hypothetical protein
MLVALVAGSACISSRIEPLRDGLAGTSITYRFPIGRLYEASYSEDQVRFALLEPEQPESPVALLPYRSRRIREGLYLVVWEGDFEIRTTLLIDLEKRRVHASALLPDGSGFFDTARIETIEESR